MKNPTGIAKDLIARERLSPLLMFAASSLLALLTINYIPDVACFHIAAEGACPLGSLTCCDKHEP